nr:hypothetical protein [Frigoriglobus tundricola]
MGLAEVGDERFRVGARFGPVEQDVVRFQVAVVNAAAVDRRHRPRDAHEERGGLPDPLARGKS